MYVGKIPRWKSYKGILEKRRRAWAQAEGIKQLMGIKRRRERSFPGLTKGLRRAHEWRQGERRRTGFEYGLCPSLVGWLWASGSVILALSSFFNEEGRFDQGIFRVLTCANDIIPTSKVRMCSASLFLVPDYGNKTWDYFS